MAAKKASGVLPKARQPLTDEVKAAAAAKRAATLALKKASGVLPKARKPLSDDASAAVPSGYSCSPVIMIIMHYLYFSLSQDSRVRIGPLCSLLRLCKVNALTSIPHSTSTAPGGSVHAVTPVCGLKKSASGRGGKR